MRKTIVLFYFLLFYASAQLVWWGVLLVRSEGERAAMIIGEGIFFMIIFVLGAFRLKRAFLREHKVQQQQHNFLLAVTHEFKSPLAAIKLYIQTILKRELNKEQQQQFLSNSLKDIERLDDLVENVLIATKLDSVRPNFPKEQINLSLLIEQVVSRLQLHSCQSNVIHANIEPDIAIEADKFALTNAVTNLIENAVKYSSAGDPIHVLLQYENNRIYFRVIDQGIGISDSEKKLIFNKFYRIGNEDTRKTKGTGLGLYIVKTVLEKHNASIKVKDNTPKGSIFEVIFNANATN